jgi:hypothetical protein
MPSQDYREGVSQTKISVEVEHKGKELDHGGEICS